MRKFYFSLHRLLLLVLCLSIATVAVAQQNGGRDFFLLLDNYHGQIQWEQSTDRQTWTEVPNGSVGKVKLTPTQTTLYRAKVTAPGCSPFYSDVKAAFFDKDRVVAAKLIKGKVNIPAEATVGLNDYTIMSEVESGSLKSDGSFEILAADSTEQDVLLVLNSKEEVTMLGHYIGPQEEYIIDSESSAMAMLVMYPFLKPVSVSEKNALIKSYRAEAEFEQLISKVEALAIKSDALFSSDNDGIRSSINHLINKNYNKDRFRLQSVNDLISHPLDISSDGASVNIINSQPFSYVGSIYRKNDKLNVKAFFIVPGTLLRSSSFVQTMRPSGYNIEKEDLQYERIFDLKSLGKEEGEYEIILRSGLAMDNTDEDNLARGENLYEMLMYILDNLSLGIANKNKIDKRPAECFGALADVMSNRVKAEITTNPNTDILKEVVIPGLSAVYDGAGKCGNSNFFSFTSKVLKFIDIFNKKEEHLAAWTFPLSWVAANEEINACQYLGQNPVTKKFKTTSCFIFNKITKTDSSYFPGDTIPITVGAFTNHKYYPYFGDVIKELDFTWLTLNGVFAPDGKINPAGKTNSKGEATVKWLLPCKEEKTTVTISLPGIDFSLYKDFFETMTKVPPLKFEVTGGDNQIGEKGKMLPVPISFYLKNLDDKALIPAVNLSRFNIKWEVLKEGKWEEILGTNTLKDDPKNENKHVFVRKYWTLDNIGGEQKIRAFIEDKCGMKWPIEGNPVIFSANKETRLTRIEMIYEGDDGIYSHNYEYNEQGKIIKDTEYEDQTKNPINITIFTHNTANQLVRVDFDRIKKSYNHEINYYDLYEYDNVGNLIKIMSYASNDPINYLNRNIDRTTFKYDSKKRLIQENWYAETHYSDTVVSKSSSTKTLEYIGDTDNIYKLKTYDDKNELSKVFTYENYIDKINPLYLLGHYNLGQGGYHSRNAPGKETMEMMIDGRKVREVTSFSYKYNEKGDVIERKSDQGETVAFTYADGE